MATTTPETYKLGGTTPYPVTAAGLAQCAIDDLAVADSCVASYLSQHPEAKVTACQTAEACPVAGSLVQPYLGKATAEILKSSFKYVALQSFGYKATTTHEAAQSNTYVKRPDDNLEALFNETYARVKKAQNIVCPGKSIPPPARPDYYDHVCNTNKLVRMARISGMYAKSFIALEQMGVNIPFVGTAAFASNVVRWNVTIGMEQVNYFTMVDAVQRLQAQYPGITPPLFPVHDGVVMLSDLLSLTFIGNYLVFMEIFPIVDFTIRYLNIFGIPSADDTASMNKLRLAQDKFVIYWEKAVQTFTEVVDAVGSSGIFLIDRDSHIRDGLGMCLNGKILEGSRDKILLNEQMLTLDEYMWKKMQAYSPDVIPDWVKEWQPKTANPIPNARPWFLDGDMKFTYDSDEQINAFRFILEFGEGDITDFKSRYPFTQDVVARFYDLYYRGSMEEKVRVLDGLHRMTQDAEGF